MTALPPTIPTGAHALRPEHREHLRGSGLSDDTIAAAAIVSIGAEQAWRLGFAQNLAGIAFPYPGTEIVVDAEPRTYTRLRVDPERVRAAGRKYENPLRQRIQRGLTYYPYVPETVVALSKDTARPVFVTEGEKKALKLCQEGFPAIGIPGVYMFTDPSSRKPAQSKPLHPDLARWRWRGRTAFVCFDSDRVEKDGVALAHERLCAALTREGALVRAVRLPRLEGMDKTGADDYLAAAGVEAFSRLVEEALPWEPFAWVVDLLPEQLPESALDTALEPLRRRIVRASPQELRAVAVHLVRRFPVLSEEDALRVLLPAAEGTAAGLPRIVVNGRQVRDVVADAWKALGCSPLGRRLFRLDEALVFAPSDPPCAGRPFVMQGLDQSLLTALLHRCATWLVVGEKGVSDTRAPADVARDMLSMPDRQVPPLDAVVGLPVLRRDGTVAAGDGYDPQSRLFQAVEETVVAVVAGQPVVPGPAERAAALELLTGDLLGDFPFARASDRAHLLAALLLPAVRHWIAGPVPLHLIEAPTEGTGKTLLADVVALVATGAPSQPTPLLHSEEEVRKKITATLLASPQVVLLDNLGHALDSESRAACGSRRC